MEPDNQLPKPSQTPGSSAPDKSFLDTFLAACQKLLQSLARALKTFGAFLKRNWKKFASLTRRSWKKFLRRFTKWIDPKLEPYRAHPKASSPVGNSTATSSITMRPTTASTSTPEATSPDHLKSPNFTKPQDLNNPSTSHPSVPMGSIDDAPRTRADIFETLAQAPHSIFTQRERKMMTNLLDLPDIKASSIMLPATKIVYVSADEVLGPLTLDRLYRSGFDHFPVKDVKGELIGCVHTTHFNNLDIKKSARVADILDPGLYFVRDDYSLERVPDVFLRTNAFFFLATDRYGKIVGFLTFNDFMHHLFGTNPKDSFDRDNDRLAVASRRE